MLDKLFFSLFKAEATGFLSSECWNLPKNLNFEHSSLFCEVVFFRVVTASKPTSLFQCAKHFLTRSRVLALNRMFWLFFLCEGGGCHKFQNNVLCAQRTPFKLCHNKQIGNKLLRKYCICFWVLFSKEWLFPCSGLLRFFHALRFDLVFFDQSESQT